MNESKRGNLVAGIVLIALGALFFALNLIPGIDARKTWPLILVVLGVGFCLPAFIWPKSRENLAGLFIPGFILIVLGGIFLFCTLTQRWVIWAIAWMLIPASVGLGLFTAAITGRWDVTVKHVGLWMLGISLATFAIFAALFSDILIKSIGAGILLLTGLILLIRSFVKKPAAE